MFPYYIQAGTAILTMCVGPNQFKSLLKVTFATINDYLHKTYLNIIHEKVRFRHGVKVK